MTLLQTHIVDTRFPQSLFLTEKPAILVPRICHQLLSTIDLRNNVIVTMRGYKAVNCMDFLLQHRLSINFITLINMILVSTCTCHYNQ